jgi:hypothetical protein
MAKATPATAINLIIPLLPFYVGFHLSLPSGRISSLVTDVPKLPCQIAALRQNRFKSSSAGISHPLIWINSGSRACRPWCLSWRPAKDSILTAPCGSRADQCEVISCRLVDRETIISHGRASSSRRMDEALAVHRVIRHETRNDWRDAVRCNMLDKVSY